MSEEATKRHIATFKEETVKRGAAATLEHQVDQGRSGLAACYRQVVKVAAIDTGIDFPLILRNHPCNLPSFLV